MKKFACAFLSFLLVTAFFVPVSATGYRVITEPQYNMAESMKGTITKVSKNSKWALADQNGVAITGYDWDTLGAVDAEYIPAKKNDKWGFINQSGTVLIAYKYPSVSCFKDGIAIVQQTSGAYVGIDVNENVLFLSPFAYTFAPSEGAICGILNDLYGFCDATGHIFIAPQFDMAYDFHEGYAAVKFAGKWGYIDTYGGYVITPTYDYASDFKGGHAVCRLGEKYGIINAAGSRTASFTFDFIGPRDDLGRYPAKSGAVTGYINENGNWIIKTANDFCYPYTDGVARIYRDGKWGFIDESGNELISPTFTDCGEYQNGSAPYSLDGTLWGYLAIDFELPSQEPFIPDISPTENPQSPENTETFTPLAPDGEKCISLRIGSTIAMRGNNTYTLSAAPVLINGTTMIPVRDVIELLGGKITWDALAQQVTINKNHKSITLKIGSNRAFAAGSFFNLPQAPMLINSSTMVPLRTVTDSFGCPVTWIDTHQNIYIYDK